MRNAQSREIQMQVESVPTSQGGSWGVRGRPRPGPHVPRAPPPASTELERAPGTPPPLHRALFLPDPPRDPRRWPARGTSTISPRGRARLDGAGLHPAAPRLPCSSRWTPEAAAVETALGTENAEDGTGRGCCPTLGTEPWLCDPIRLTSGLLPGHGAVPKAWHRIRCAGGLGMGAAQAGVPASMSTAPAPPPPTPPRDSGPGHSASIDHRRVSG